MVEHQPYMNRARPITPPPIIETNIEPLKLKNEMVLVSIEEKLRRIYKINEEIKHLTKRKTTLLKQINKIKAK